jgi:hypothetical protein
MPTVEFSSDEVNKAAEAWGEGGVRQLRMVKYEDRDYIDKRDVNWIIGCAKHTQWLLMFQNFWAQIALCGILDDMAGVGLALIQARVVITRLTFGDFWTQVAIAAVLQTMGPVELGHMNLTFEGGMP